MKDCLIDEPTVPERERERERKRERERERKRDREYEERNVKKQEQTRIFY